MAALGDGVGGLDSVHKYGTSITRAYNGIAERKRIAVVAAARKLLLWSFSMLKNKRPHHDQA
jgi:hypothetical protein